MTTKWFFGRWWCLCFWTREFSRSNPWNIWWSSCIVQKLHMCDAWNVPMWKRPPGWFWEDAITRGHFVIWRCGKQRLKRIYICVKMWLFWMWYVCFFCCMHAYVFASWSHKIFWCTPLSGYSSPTSHPCMVCLGYTNNFVVFQRTLLYLKRVSSCFQRF